MLILALGHVSFRNINNELLNPAQESIYDSHNRNPFSNQSSSRLSMVAGTDPSTNATTRPIGPVNPMDSTAALPLGAEPYLTGAGGAGLGPVGPRPAASVGPDTINPTPIGPSTPRPTADVTPATPHPATAPEQPIAPILPGTPEPEIRVSFNAFHLYSCSNRIHLDFVYCCNGLFVLIRARRLLLSIRFHSHDCLRG